MYRMKSDSDSNKFFKYARHFVYSLPRNRRMVFLCKYIIYSMNNRDDTGVFEGIRKLFSLDPEFMRYWEIANKTYTDSEGERIDLLYRHAYKNPDG